LDEAFTLIEQENIDITIIAQKPRRVARVKGKFNLSSAELGELLASMLPIRGFFYLLIITRQKKTDES
jgi:hypothetical protein